MRFFGPLALGLTALAGCNPQVEKQQIPPAPALWQIEGASGDVEGWLFGTIHALPDGVNWRSASLSAVVASADTLVVEATGIMDADTSAEIFTRLATTPDLAPLVDRVPRHDQPKLAVLMADAGFDDGDFVNVETWAAALALANSDRTTDPANGVDRAFLAEFPNDQTIELEGVGPQLSIFDRLPEREQRDLLLAIMAENGRQPGSSERLAMLWRAGDLDEIRIEADQGILADPELYVALYTERNLAWTTQITDMLAGDGRPFIAVGAAHLAGRDSLVSMLESRGYVLRRLQ